VAQLARRDYGGDPVTDEEWARVFSAFGPRVPSVEQLSRRIGNPELSAPGMELLRRLDILDQLPRIMCPTLVSVGSVDPVTPVAAAKEIITALPPGIGRLEMIDGSGHFPWLDHPETYWSLITAFATAA